jgi:hypothetical protein
MDIHASVGEPAEEDPIGPPALASRFWGAIDQNNTGYFFID